jgi:hypothetical protein
MMSTNSGGCPLLDSIVRFRKEVTWFPVLALLRIPPSVPRAYFNQPGVLAATENYHILINISDVNRKDGIKRNIDSVMY